MKRCLFKAYGPKRVFWLIRCNLSWMKEMKNVEVTLGLLGYGILILYSYRKDVMK